MDAGTDRLARFKSVLLYKKAELCRLAVQRDDIIVERTPDELDAAMQASEREIAVRKHDRENLLLRNVDAALRRIDTGEFGTCIHCEEEINPKRLEAVPWSPFCLNCQEAVDRREMGVLASLRSMLDAA